MILAFDTATDATSVALCDPAAGLTLEARDDPAPGARPGHQTRLLPLIVELLGRAGTGWAGVERIAVGIGPGTFTGLRIGIATARALGQARGIPVVGLSSLHSLAWGARREPLPDIPRPILAVLDARRGEAFAAAWQSAHEGTLRGILEPRVVRPGEIEPLIAELASETQPLAIGTGALEFRVQLERAGAIVPAEDSKLHRITAINHCQLACGLPGAGPAKVRPEYLRLPDAEITRRTFNDSK
jgi:tRNA threonylcarbamoyladenosine biosynthesis protein TsaB